jgi:Ni,Fe-hydrogenase III small subunit/Pyruvate/2-oxoacid:ferredoxin oxidoreductase delta subunit
MLDVLRTRLQQKYRTMSYPDGQPPELPARFAGRPVLSPDACEKGCRECTAVCPTGAVQAGPGGLRLDTGRCLFCRACEQACGRQAISFGHEHRLAAGRRQDLVVAPGAVGAPASRHALAARLFKRSFKLRQVSAGGCNACEADANVLGTLAWDMGRFGIQFVASPRHADGLLITGPVTRNMRLALEKTYAAVPAPKVVIAVGACAVSGGCYAGHPEQCDGAADLLPVDLFIPGCPPHPLTILDGLLRLIGRIADTQTP